jgi:hypothetical protein
MDVKIEAYEPKHAAAFKALNEEWITTYFKLEEPDRIALDNPQAYILDRGGHILVATLDKEVVGVCALLRRDDIDAFELAKMAVSPRVQGIFAWPGRDRQSEGIKGRTSLP